MARILVTGTTLHVGTDFFPEGEHDVPDDFLQKVQGIKEVTVLPSAPASSPTRSSSKNQSDPSHSKE